MIMTPETKSTAARIIAGIVTAIVVFLAGAVLASQSRITALEVKVQIIEQALRDSRLENREEHRLITDKLDIITREVRK